MPFVPTTAPFYAQRLTDLINQEVLEFICAGFASRQGFAWTIVQYGNDAKLERIPKRDYTEEWSKFCSMLRSDPRGDALCLQWDDAHTRRVLARQEKGEWYPCHAGMWDIALPVEVAGKTLAAFFGGQRRKTGSDDELLQKLQRLPAAYAALTGERRTEADEKLRAKGLQDAEWHPDVRRLADVAHMQIGLDNAALADLKLALEDAIKKITEVAFLRFESESQYRNEQFLDQAATYFLQEYTMNRNPADRVLKELFNGLNVYAGLRRTCFYSMDQFLSGIDTGSPDSAQTERALPGIADIVTKFAAVKDAKSDKMWLIDEDVSAEHRTCAAEVRKVVGDTGAGKILIRISEIAEYGRVEFVFFDDAAHPSSKAMTILEKAELCEKFIKHIRALLHVVFTDMTKEEFMASAIHRFRSPLQWACDCQTAISDSLDAARGTSTDETEQAKTEHFDEAKLRLAEINAYLIYMGRITENICASVGVNYRRSSLNTRWFNLGNLAVDVEERVHAPAKRRRIDIKIANIAGTAAFVRADEDKIRTVMENLVDNALKYSYPYETIYVTVTRRTADLMVSIRNRGLGIPGDEQRLIFYKFFRSSVVRHPRRAIPGTGIGLAVAREFVGLHGGRISVTSRKNGREIMSDANNEDWERFETEFTFTIPTR